MANLEPGRLAPGMMRRRGTAAFVQLAGRRNGAVLRVLTVVVSIAAGAALVGCLSSHPKSAAAVMSVRVPAVIAELVGRNPATLRSALAPRPCDIDRACARRTTQARNARQPDHQSGQTLMRTSPWAAFPRRPSCRASGCYGRDT